VHAARRRIAGRIPTSSLADIAFLLLIFFLVTTVFDEEKGLALVLPPPGDTAAIAPDNVLQLRVLPDGVVEVRRGRSSHIRALAAADVAALWRAESEHAPDLVAAVQTHPEAPYRRMVDVLDALHGVGAQRISLQRLPPD
jgi:biopolymer transport protein ExbD